MTTAMNKTFMYHLTLQPSTSVTQAILGQFAGTREQQVLTSSGSRLTLYRLDPQQRKVTALLSHDVFGVIRAIAAFRLPGSSKDYIIIGSDSGRISIIEYHPEKNLFKRVHLETFGKSGVRRVIPGQYLAVDPKGRAAMLASVEKNKLVYVLNRNAQAELTISSPLEAHRANCLVFATVALDVGYDNPTFASLEVEYGDSDQDPTGQAYEDIEKQLVFYELDLGLNHVVRKWTDAVDRSANKLFHVPGGADGPSGVLVCAEDTITYRHMNQDPQRVPIPRRKGATDDPERKRHIVAGVAHRMKGGFFFLLQTEDGDLFKATIDMEEDAEGRPTGEVKSLRLIYFDTVPVATSLLILKSGHLFVASESGDHHFYQFGSLGEENEEKEVHSTNYSSNIHDALAPAFFHPRPAENLMQSESINSNGPLMGCKVANLLNDDDAPQIYTICGTGARSTLRSMKHGIEVSEVAASELQNNPVAVWAIKQRESDEADSYIVLSFHNETIVLGIGEQVEEVSDTGLMATCHTLAVQQLGEDSILQVHPKGLRHILAGGKINEWPVPQHRTVVAAATNERQVALGLSSGELVYFELDSDGTLAEYDERKQMLGTVTALSLGPIQEGRQRSSFLAVGTDDSTVRIVSVEPDSTFSNMSIQALSATASGLCIMSMTDASGGMALQVHVGLHSGVYLRATLDEVTGDLSGAQSRFLGPKPVKVFPISIDDQPSVLALSTRAWAGYMDTQTKTNMLTPLDYPTLEWGNQINTPQFSRGIVGVAGRALKIFTVDKVSSNMLTESIPLAHTPRAFVKHPEYPIFCVIESDNNTLSSASRLKLRSNPSMVNGDAAVAALPPEDFGYPKAEGHWASCVQLVDPVSEKKAVYTLDLEDNEAAVSVAAVPFASQDHEIFLVVGTGKDMSVTPRSHSAAFIHVYRFHDAGKSLELIHKTKVEEPPLALLAFQGRMLAGIGTELRIFDLGVKQLLRKARATVVPNLIVGLHTQGSRIAVSDVRDGVVYVVYKYGDNRLVPFVDDAVARWSTCATMADYETVAGGDKFGNLWLVRCPPKISEGADEESTGGHLVHERQYLQGTPNRLELVAHFYPQDIPTSIQKVSLFPGAKDIILWSGLQGTLGMLIPFADKVDADMFQTLEAHMRSEDPPIAGRDHLIYRSYYAPVKSVVDGDLIERFMRLPFDKKASIAAEMDKEVVDLESKISRMRISVAF